MFPDFSIDMCKLEEFSLCTLVKLGHGIGAEFRAEFMREECRSKKVSCIIRPGSYLV
jgi:hypothetical protein